jgi:hypothetical protein
MATAMDSVWGSTHLKRSEVFTSMIKEMFEDQVFAQGMVRQINDFGDGDNYLISSIGELQIDQMSESVSLPERRPDTGQFVFNINEFVGTKVPFTDKFLEDDFLAPAAIASLPRKMKRAFDEYYETQVLKLHQVQTNDDFNVINNGRHRITGGGGGTTGVLNLQDFAYTRYALQKAKVPLQGLVAIVPPSFEFNQNITANLVDISFNPRWEGIIETGLGAGDAVRFIRNIYGWDVFVSDYLDTATATETSVLSYDDDANGGVAVGDKFAQFMSLADDETKPYIGAWRRTPSMVSWRDEDIETEYHQLSARFGLNLYRPESLVTVATADTLN